MLGVGSMGGAILQGLRARGAGDDQPLSVTTRSVASAEAFAGASDVVAYASEVEPQANRIAVRGAGLVILAVKPWMILDVAREIAGDLAPGTIVVSVATGVPSAALAAELPAGVAVVRAMPNTPSHVGLGLTGIAAGPGADDAAIATVSALFETVGKVLVVHEDQINDVTAVSGSGPAYVFLYAEEMMGAARRLGFSEADARLLVEQTVVGAAELWRSSGEDPAQLRRNVTSPKGTTEKAVEVLQAANWGALFDRALAANIARSRALEAGE